MPLALDSAAGYWRLAKPRVVALVVFTAAVGAALALLDGARDWRGALWGVFGVALVAAAAAAANCLAEREIDARMERTRRRPLPMGVVTPRGAALFAALVGAAGLFVIGIGANPLTMWLAGAAFVGYAGIYTLLLKRATPQNIVIGGAAGAAPPVMGWTAAAGEISPLALSLFLIVFVWTPPHFWSLALYRAADYARVQMPMLPVTHGAAYTRLQVLLYSALLFAVSLLPAALGAAGAVYLAATALLGGRFLLLAHKLWRDKSAATARRLFVYSISYLGWLFFALFADRALAFWLGEI